LARRGNHHRELAWGAQRTSEFRQSNLKAGRKDTSCREGWRPYHCNFGGSKPNEIKHRQTAWRKGKKNPSKRAPLTDRVNCTSQRGERGHVLFYHKLGRKRTSPEKGGAWVPAANQRNFRSRTKRDRPIVKRRRLQTTGRRTCAADREAGVPDVD